jgi:hypothetical protein
MNHKLKSTADHRDDTTSMELQGLKPDSFWDLKVAAEAATLKTLFERQLVGFC